jgi:DNA-binding IclR family transcriptional regulator
LRQDILSDAREILRRLLLASGGLVAIAVVIGGIVLAFDSSPSERPWSVACFLGAGIGFYGWRRLVNWILLFDQT